EAKIERDRLQAERDRLEAEAKIERDRLEAEAKIERDRLQAERDRLEAEAKIERDRKEAESNAKYDRMIAELKRTVERTSQSVDNLTSRWGRFVEELVEPAVLDLFQSKGIDVKEIYPRARVKRQGIAMEIDILAVDDTELVLVECKSKLSKDDVDDFVEKLSRFKVAFPHYKNYQAYGAVAGIEINDGIDRYAYRQGLFVIKPSGKTVTIANDENFRPKTW
ncbi:MAG: DUF3782 domain-containing protein, partial [Microcystaceae cyanobacterium]